MLVVARYAPAKHYRLQVQLLAQLFTGIVKAAAQPQPPEVGVDKDLDAVEGIALRVVGIERIVAGDLFVRVRRLQVVGVDQDRQGYAYYLPVDLHHHLPLREAVDQPLYRTHTPETALPLRVGCFHGVQQLLVIIHR